MTQIKPNQIVKSVKSREESGEGSPEMGKSSNASSELK